MKIKHEKQSTSFTHNKALSYGLSGNKGPLSLMWAIIPVKPVAEGFAYH
jgi:hypothetical protein